MKIDTISQLKNCLSNNEIQNICILDNNSIEFLLKVKNEISISEFFNSYNLVLLPHWVEVEVNDSIYRTEYINELAGLENIKFCSMPEYWYLDLIENRDSFLFIIFQEVIRLDSKLNAFINRRILNGNPIEDLAEYEEWMTLLYDDGFESTTLKNGRIKKKNAGEISIAVLAFIISRFYDVKYITVISQDGGTYKMIKEADSNISSKIANEYDNPITFKSNDCIINEFYKLGHLRRRVDSEISKLRSPRKVKYTRLKDDRSIEERDKTISNEEFIALLEDKTVQIIF